MHRRAVSLTIPRFTRGLALVALVLATGCDKSGGGTKDPGGEGGGGEKPSKAGSPEFAYANTFVLDGQITVDFSNDSPEGKGSAKIIAKTRLDATPAQAKTKLHGKVVELVEYTGTGSLDAEFLKQQMAKNGTPDFDLLASLRTSEEWMIVDSSGELDDEASKALAENAAEKESMGGSDFGLFNLPDLPTVGLELGKQTKLPTEEKDENMFGQVIPMEVDRTWTLVSITAAADGSGHQIAQLQVISESSGAVELEGGQGMLAVGQESTFEIAFDIDAKIPVSLSGESMFELSFEGGGQSMSFQNQSKISATYSLVAAGG